MEQIKLKGGSSFFLTHSV